MRNGFQTVIPFRSRYATWVEGHRQQVLAMLAISSNVIEHPVFAARRREVLNAIVRTLGTIQ